MISRTVKLSESLTINKQLANTLISVPIGENFYKINLPLVIMSNCSPSFSSIPVTPLSYDSESSSSSDE